MRGASRDEWREARQEATMTKAGRGNIGWLVALAILCAGTVWAVPTLLALDGTSWRVDVNPDAQAKDKGEQDFSETITFADGKLVTNEGVNLGFGSASYTVSRSGEKDWNFTAEQTSSTQGKYVWSGTIHGGDIRGKLVWTKSDNTRWTYSFKGDKKD
jgi:hypothetical protein